MCDCNVRVYLYDPDCIERAPLLISTLSFPERVHSVYLVNKMGVVCFGMTQLDVFKVWTHNGKTKV